ncbi:hypothetical protein [Anaerosinus gibii]|uniref:Uncharacterized protein n=1 Tax=Selenobaculum gibii TaxID=3054208 RepID=A0A9Y2AKZ0_9FIRM|nr:hypothetical protein [Selenobaculum gbiensis]WIW71535.1 hypothetical protein P3F81_04315 [Selenobaculum gbiensis]
MNKLTKGFVAIAMVGVLQIGFTSAVLEASPRDDRPPQRVNHHDKHRDKAHYDKEMKKEKERHEKEMKRHPGESRHEWEKRKHEEEKRHQNEMDRIAALLVGIAIGSSL